jgi:hypothetical protein
VAHFALNSGGPSEVRELGEEAVGRCAASDSHDAGNLICMVLPGKTAT